MSVHVLVGVIIVEGLRLRHLKVIQPGLLRVERVQLIFGQVVDDSRPVGVPDHVDRGAETIPACRRGGVMGNTRGKNYQIIKNYDQGNIVFRRSWSASLMILAH